MTLWLCILLFSVVYKRVRVTHEELSIIARTYLTDPADWEQVVLNMQANYDKRDARTRDLYQTLSVSKLKARCTDKFGLLLRGKCVVEDPDVK